MNRILQACLAVCLFGTALSGQGVPPVEEALEVQLVNVSVLVTDSEGNPVLDLERGDFQVFEDGQSVDLTHFSAPGGSLPAFEGDGGGGASAGREEVAATYSPGTVGRYIIFWDELNTSAAYRAPLLAQILTVLDSQLNPQDLVMVASFDGSIQVRQPFTRNRKQLIEALKELAYPRSTNFSFVAESERAMEIIQFGQESRYSGANTDASETNSGTGPNFPTDDPCVDVGYLARTHADSAHNRLMGTIGALTRFVDSLAGVPGRKALLHVSDGMPLIAGGEVWEYAIELCDPRGVNAGLDLAFAVPESARYSRFDPNTARMDMTSYDTSSDWQRLAAHANNNQVTFYPVQLTGLRTAATVPIDGARRTLETASFGHHNLQDSLVLIAQETGGSALLNTNDFRPGLGKMVRDGQSVYELAFPPSSGADGQRHSIRVAVTRPGVEVRYRQSYQSKTVEERVIDGLFSTLLHGYEDNPLDVRMKITGQTEVDDATSRVVAQIRLPISKLVLFEQGEALKGTFVAYLVARDARGRTTEVRNQYIPVTLSGENRQKQARKDFVYEVDLELRRLPHDIALAIRDNVGGTASYVRTSTRVN